MTGSDSALQHGDRLGRYTIRHELGAGGMGVVYEAWDTDLERKVAVKVLPRELIEDAERRLRFLREARSAAAVSHRNIAVIHEVGEEDDRVYIAMELVEGETLEDRIAAGPLPPADAALIALEIARGVAKAHEAGIIHRDLKPANVMLDDDGGVKILDFGLAKRMMEEPDVAEESAETVSMYTEEGRILGTPGYMAPEQAEARPLGPPADVFAIGAILYEMLTGRKAFTGRSSALRLAATLKDDPPSVRDLVPDAPTRLADLTASCLRKRPDARPEDAGVLVEALEALADELPSGPRITIRPANAKTHRSDITLAGGDTVLAPRSALPRRPYWALLAIPLIGVAIFWWTTRTRIEEGPPTPPPTDFLTAPETVVACPIWKVKGQQGPPGRLGAAAATQACADWGLLVGQTDKRGPARLLDLPILPVDDFPPAPFAAEDARDETLKKAKELPVMVDGELVVGDREFEVTVRVGEPGRAFLGTAAATHSSLDIAIHDAIRELAKGLGIDESQPLPSGLSQITPCDDAGCFLDRNAEIDSIMQGLDRPQSCQSLAKRDPFAAASHAKECGHEGRREDGLPSWPEHLPEALAKLPEEGRLFWSALLRLHALTPAKAKTEAERVRRVRTAVDENDFIRIPLAVAEATLLFRAGELRTAQPLLDAAYELEPGNCDTRRIAYQLALDASERVQLARAAKAWCPSVATVWTYQFHNETAEMRDLELARTAYYLRSGDVGVGVHFAETLLLQGRAHEARAVASKYLRGDGDEKLVGAFVFAFIDVAEGRIGAGLDQLAELLGQLDALGTPGLHAADWTGVALAMEAGELNGRSEAMADLVLERFLLTDPAKVETTGPLLFAYATSYASPPVADASRLRLLELMKSGKLWKLAEVETYLEGVRLMKENEPGSAAETWRPLVGKAVYKNFLRPEVFDAAGEPGLGSVIDAKAIEIGPGLAFMSHVREAKRAAARGETERARTLAKEFVDAWSTADVKIAAVDEMRELLRSL